MEAFFGNNARTLLHLRDQLRYSAVFMRMVWQQAIHRKWAARMQHAREQRMQPPELTEIHVEEFDLYKLESGIFTCESVATGEHRTFKVERSTDPEKDCCWVSLLTGPDNERDYKAFGLVNNKGQVFTFKSTRYGQWLKLAKFLQDINRHLKSGKFKLYHQGTCLRCGRTLTVGESTERGFGPTCWGKM